MRTDGRTDMTKLIAALRTFAKAPNKPFIVSLNAKCMMLCSWPALDVQFV
jgi:hypothetical protein